MGAIFTVLFGCLGGFVVLVASVTGTCTQDVADQLGLAFLAIPFHLVALGCLAASSGRLQRMIAIVLLLPVYLWQAWFGAAFGVRVLLWGQSACDALGFPGHGPDRRQLTYVITLLFVGFGLPLAAALILRWRGRA